MSKALQNLATRIDHLTHLEGSAYLIIVYLVIFTAIMVGWLFTRI